MKHVDHFFNWSKQISTSPKLGLMMVIDGMVAPRTTPNPPNPKQASRWLQGMAVSVAGLLALALAVFAMNGSFDSPPSVDVDSGSSTTTTVPRPLSPFPPPPFYFPRPQCASSCGDGAESTCPNSAPQRDRGHPTDGHWSHGPWGHPARRWSLKSGIMGQVPEVNQAHHPGPGPGWSGSSRVRVQVEQLPV